MAEEHYGAIPAKGEAEPRIRPQEPPKRTARRLEMSDPRVAQPRMIRTVLAAERDPGAQEDAAALTVLAALLGGHRRPRIWRSS